MKLSGELQRANKALILQTIYENAPISRIGISGVTGLNKATVSTIVHDFLESGLIRESGIIPAESGRKSMGLTLHMASFAAVVVRIKRSHLMSAVYDLSDDLQNLRRCRYRDSLHLAGILDQMEEEIRCQLDYCREHGITVLGISIATLGSLFTREGTHRLHVEGFRTLSDGDICREMRDRFPQYRIIMNHDANASAVAELRKYHREQGCCPDVFLSIVGGIGLGGGILIRGKCLQGFHGIAGEIGHLGLNCFAASKGINGDTVFSRSIFEEFASPASLQRTVQEHLYDYPDSELLSDASLEEIYDAYDRGDPLAEWAVNRMARFLAYGLAGLIYTLDPEVIVLGDEIPRSGKFKGILSGFLADFLPDNLLDGLKIRFSAFVGDSSLVGAGIMLVTDMMQSRKILDCIDAKSVSSK
ncbi:MAG: ROK family protein [Clostridia bacterium]|nr:ROK family protein [Clostridia bacterium]